MRVAIVCAGFTPGEADQLRKSMATFKFTGGVAPPSGQAHQQAWSPTVMSRSLRCRPSSSLKALASIDFRNLTQPLLT